MDSYHAFLICIFIKMLFLHFFLFVFISINCNVVISGLIFDIIRVWVHLNLFSSKMQETGGCKGIKLASGQDIFSQQVVLDSSFEVPSSMLPSNVVDKKLNSYSSYKVARGVCITNSSILPDSSNVLVIFPPKCKIKSVIFILFLICYQTLWC